MLVKMGATLGRAALAAFLLATIAACSAPDPRAQTAWGIPGTHGWVDSTMVPPNANKDDLFISNSTANGG